MRTLKWVGIAFAAYALLVVAFETFLGAAQPSMERSSIPILVLTTTDASGAHDRRLAQMESGGQLYVSAHHWPRAWYGRALESPEVRVILDDGTAGDYTAVAVEDGEEFARVAADWPIPLPASFLMGFAPRSLLRLDPRS